MTDKPKRGRPATGRVASSKGISLTPDDVRRILRFAPPGAKAAKTGLSAAVRYLLEQVEELEAERK
jgi:hypothetical protein